MGKLETQRPAGEIQIAGDFHQRSQRHAFERYRMAASQLIQVDTVAVIGRKHGQASQPAFGRLRLLDDWEPPFRVGEVQQVQCHLHILTLSKGSRNHVTSERCSRMMSAFRSMSAWSVILAPYASISGRSSVAVTR